MAVTAILRVSFQMMLVFLGTSDIVCQRQHFHYNFIPVGPPVNKDFCLFQMLFRSAVYAGSVLLAHINALFVQAIRVDDFKQMLHQIRDSGSLFIKNHLHAFCISIIRAVQGICFSIPAVNDKLFQISSVIVIFIRYVSLSDSD